MSTKPASDLTPEDLAKLGFILESGDYPWFIKDRAEHRVVLFISDVIEVWAIPRTGYVVMTLWKVRFEGSVPADMVTALLEKV